MKFRKILSLALFTLFTLFATAQDDNMQWYNIHEDIVSPSKVGEYEKIAKELRDNLTKYNIAEAKYLATMTEDFRYMYISPIDKMADLDVNTFKNLSEKMGKENLSNLFDRMNQCYDKHGSYILGMDKEMSYMPDGISQTQKGMPYRVFTYYHTTPANAKALREAGMAIKQLATEKGSKMHYRVYRSGFGVVGAYYMVAISAKSEKHFAELNAETNELLGPRMVTLMGNVMAKTTKYETFRGMMRDDLGYTPATPSASNKE